MNFGVYVHIPYCIQRCRYCDFTTFEQNSIMPPQEYLALLEKEISTRAIQISQQDLTSLYFGGGTPSLLPVNYIQKIINKLGAMGLHITDSTEVTIEINPTTVDQQKIKDYLSLGINRFSVGAQTFSDELLKLCGREHNVHQTRECLDWLAHLTTNFSLDILYGLPKQSFAQLRFDLEAAMSFHPQHISAYCLTLPQGHPMNQNRPKEKIQIDMLECITDSLNAKGLKQYEISNFANPGFESQHNLLYWKDQAYWGIGLSAHSSFPHLPHSQMGLRFWNPKDFKTYIHQVNNPRAQEAFPHEYLDSSQFEKLNIWESLTDFCHISLRLNEGLSKDALRYRFGPEAVNLLEIKFKELLLNKLVQLSSRGWSLTALGRRLSNQVFFSTTFLKEDFPG
ncbi:MAG: radical SAM family heme chaperone HemW [Bdellovibrionaceae bacterium]|nr:radical SAM family heme chaperone HemW [Pseudobdellovibrionaceae bacterium]